MTQFIPIKYRFSDTIAELLTLPLLIDMDDKKRIQTLYTLSNHAEEHYRAVSVKKQHSGKRDLLIPDVALKSVQRQILDQLLSNKPISNYAKAYYTGATIRQNASLHVHKPIILKLDIQNFFSSILFPQVLSCCFSGKEYSVAVGTLLTSLCCYKGYLPQGAPTSPTISNLVMYSFDNWIGDWCSTQEIMYTRYCDDMTFSGDFDSKEVIRRVSSFLQDMGMELNQNKTKLCTSHRQQLVTGVVVNEKLQVPRAYRRMLRQELYYCMKYGVQEHLVRKYNMSQNDITTEQCKRYLQSLLGKVNYVLQINSEDKEFQQAAVAIKQWMKAQ